MLVIISDLHLTDGTSGETIRAVEFRTFRDRLEDLAYNASNRTDGKYRPIESLDVVLLGDILDVIRSTKWLGQQHRPWDKNPQAPGYAKLVRNITDGILEENSKSLEVLRKLAKEGVTIPAATLAGKVRKGVSHNPDAPGRIPVKVRIHYLVGNHDWFFHLPGTAYNKTRRAIVKAMGLANSIDPFPHDPYDSDRIMDTYRRHRVFARHGDIYDPFNFDGDRNSSSLGDAIVIELLNQFPSEVERELGDDLPKACREGLKEIDNVRPLLMIPLWVNGLLKRTSPDKGVTKKVKEIWDRLADRFLQLEVVRQRDTWSPLDDVDKLQAGLRISKGLSLGRASRLTRQINDSLAGKRSTFFENALSERAFKTRAAQRIVYGHTHRHEIVPLDVSYDEQGVVNQLYVNSGTWRRVHVLAQRNPKDQEFVGYNVMTYLAFYEGAEAEGRPFESWSGSLGV